MYAVNASIPKTLMRSVIRHYAASCEQVMAEKLIDICDTPVSPELVPGKQFTEEIIGSYDLHDFFIYNFIKYGDSPETLYMIACKAFKDDYTAEAILNALEVFFRRFFVSQFKRAAMPDAPDVTGIDLGKFAMPSDAAGAVWNKAVSDLKNKLK
jgi:NAD+ synthase (glutamine-hydrolysing)